MRAAEWGYEETVKSLIDAGASIDLADCHDWTALNYAEQWGESIITDYCWGFR
jgi:hypothetical protein